MQPLFIIILAIFISVSSYAQTVYTDAEETYGYDTSLVGGYTIMFADDDSMQYLYLNKGNKTITELASTSRGLPYRSLGYVGADFKSYFVLGHSYGSGNPDYIELIRKTSGKSILKRGAAWIDVDEKNGYLLYSDNDVPTPKDRMTLYNVNTGQKERYPFPRDMFDGPEILNRIRIHELSERQLVIDYDTEEGQKTKVYRR